MHIKFDAITGTPTGNLNLPKLNGENYIMLQILTVQSRLKPRLCLCGVCFCSGAAYCSVMTSGTGMWLLPLHLHRLALMKNELFPPTANAQCATLLCL